MVTHFFTAPLTASERQGAYNVSYRQILWMNRSFFGRKLHRERNDGNERKKIAAGVCLFQGRFETLFPSPKSGFFPFRGGVGPIFDFGRGHGGKVCRRGPERQHSCLFDTPEKAGRFAFSAGRAGGKGLSLYGGTPFGISLAEANILSFFQKEEFHSALIYTADWAFPIISDKDLEKRGAPFLLSLYRGLMLYAAGKENTLLGAMDRGRKFPGTPDD